MDRTDAIIETWFKKFPFMDDFCYMTKWGVIQYFIETYCLERNILDLGCGIVTINDFMTVSKWTGIDSWGGIAEFHQEKGRECFKSDLLSVPNEVRGRKTFYNCLIWIGMEPQKIPYSEVINLYLPYLIDNGIVILEYMNLMDGKTPIDRVKGIPLKHINGCNLSLPFIADKGRWKNIGERMIGVFRKEKPIERN